MTAKTIPELLDRSPAGADSTAVVSMGREEVDSLSRGKLLEQAGRLSAGLREAGLSRGDRVGLVAPNSAEWVIVALGVMQAGAILMPLDTQMPAEEFGYSLRDAVPRWVFTVSEFAGRVRDAGLDPAPELLLLDRAEDPEHGWTRLLASQAGFPVAGADDIAALFYTSGTTGAPKGVPLTHDNLASNVESLIKEELAGEHDRVLVPLPYHHVYPFTVGILIPLRLGAPIVLPFSLVGPQIVRALQQGEPTIMLGVPRLYEAIWSALTQRIASRGRVADALFRAMLAVSMGVRERLGLNPGRRLFRKLHARLAPRLRLVVSGGAALNPDLGRRLTGLGWDLATGYGLTETSPILTYNPPDRLRLESAGFALSGVELTTDPPGERGEVLARGPNVFHGYWNRPEKTAEALDDKGWYHTGDMGRLDEDGYLYLGGRRSAMIVMPGGENVDPERVENVLSSAEDIREVGILEDGGRLAAVVVPEPWLLREVQGEDLRRRLSRAVEQTGQGLPSHHRPGTLRVAMDPLPRTRLGKLRRHKLEALYQRLSELGDAVHASPEPMDVESMAQEDQQLLSDPAAKATWQYLAKRFPDVRLTPDSSPRLDLGIDSLGWVDLGLALRDRAGVELDDAALARIETVRDLLREAAGARRASETGEDLMALLRDPERALSPELGQWLEPRGTARRVAGRMILGLVRTGARLLLHVKVEGRIPDQGQYLITPRHLSLLDPAVVAVAVGDRRLNTLYWGGWTGILFSGPVRRWFSRTTNVLPVDPRTAPRNSLTLIAAALSRGRSLVWFPEGGRSPDGTLQAFQLGIGLVLRARPVPVIPVWIKGTREAMPPGRRLPRPGRVRVVIGDPIPVERLRQAGDDEKAIVELIRDNVAALERR